jgi:hypothetical protein
MAEVYVLMAVNMEITVFWNVTPCRPVKLPTFRRNKNQSQTPRPANLTEVFVVFLSFSNKNYVTTISDIQLTFLVTNR